MVTAHFHRFKNVKTDKITENYWQNFQTLAWESWEHTYNSHLDIHWNICKFCYENFFILIHFSQMCLSMTSFGKLKAYIFKQFRGHKNYFAVSQHCKPSKLNLCNNLCIFQCLQTIAVKVMFCKNILWHGFSLLSGFYIWWIFMVKRIHKIEIWSYYYETSKCGYVYTTNQISRFYLLSDSHIVMRGKHVTYIHKWMRK